MSFLQEDDDTVTAGYLPHVPLDHSQRDLRLGPNERHGSDDPNERHASPAPGEFSWYDVRLRGFDFVFLTPIYCFSKLFRENH